MSFGGINFGVVLGALQTVERAVGFYPPNWIYRSQTTSLTVSTPQSTSQISHQIGTGDPGSPDNSTIGVGSQGSPGTTTQKTTYYFDGVLSVDHAQELVLTQHPIQNGANIVDHAYLRPARVILEIGMSDLMASYNFGSWTSDRSKSVSAYQTLKMIRDQRLLCTLTTRLNTYSNLLLESLRATETKETWKSAKISAVFQEIIVANVTNAPSSARPNQSVDTPGGTIQPQALPPGLPKVGLGGP